MEIVAVNPSAERRSFKLILYCPLRSAGDASPDSTKRRAHWPAVPGVFPRESRATGSCDDAELSLCHQPIGG
jgi:hypothetical protein